MTVARESPRKTAIVLHSEDNVATLLMDLDAGDAVIAGLGGRCCEVELSENVHFGHKAAIRRIAEGEDVVKYGMPIGQALSDIEPGSWVHVHNCRSARYGFRQEKYGIHA